MSEVLELAGDDSPMSLTRAAREMSDLKVHLKEHRAKAASEEERILAGITECAKVLTAEERGLDLNKISLAETIIFVSGSYDKAGADRQSVIDDAIKSLSTGEPLRPIYGDLWKCYFGTKNYDGWRGQRSDCEYGYGPRHGVTIFKVGVVSDVRKERKQTDLTPKEIEAAIYYLVNIQSIQATNNDAIAKAEGRS